MAARERWLRAVGPEFDLRGSFFWGEGWSGVPALKKADAEAELEPEKANIAVSDYCTTRPYRDA